MITKYGYFFIIGLTIFSACKNQQISNEPLPKLKILLTHYYSVKMEDGNPVRDTLMECFHCSQAIVYNKNGQEVALRFYKKDIEKMYGFEKYQYNSEGHKIGSNYYEKDTLITEYRYELDGQNRIKIGRAYGAQNGQLLYGYQNQYDEKGNHYETGNLNSKDKIVDYYRRTFNENGIVIKENIEDLEGNPTFRVKYEYRPQADNNWVEQLTYYNGELNEIRIREKEYYD